MSSELNPGDFPLGSAKSRAAARALIQERNRPIPPPWGTLDLSFLSTERAHEVYERVRALPGGHHFGTPWFPICWPDGFAPPDFGKLSNSAHNEFGGQVIIRNDSPKSSDYICFRAGIRP
jgi:hypothetical protein